MIFSKPTFVSLSPNTEKEDILLSFKMIFKSENEKETNKAKNKLSQYLKVNNLSFFNSGRSAFFAILKTFEIGREDEVLIQSFTCNAAVNPILKRKAEPVFVDVDNTLNMDPNDLEKKITPKSKAVVLQHTFGWPAQIKKIKDICQRNNLILIEDAAHSLGAKYEDSFCGTMGDASFFSFGRDKIISSVFGGAAFIKDNDKFKKLDDFCQSLPFPSRLWTFQQLLHPILTNYIVIPVYGVSFFLGKILIGFFHKTLLLSKSVYKKEKKGMLADFFPKKMPSSLSSLFSKQIGKLERFNEHRRKIAEIYSKEISKEKYSLLFPEEFSKITPIFMRYPILAKFETDDILKKMRKNGIYLNDGWRKSPIVPPDTDLKSVSYTLGSCPNAEEISKKIINLPTHINVSEKKARKIIKLLNLC